MNMRAEWQLPSGKKAAVRVVGAHNADDTLTVVVTDPWMTEVRQGEIYFAPKSAITVDVWALQSLTVNV